MKEYKPYCESAPSSSILVPDAIRQMGIEGTPLAVEGSGNKVCEWLDRYSGIDWLTKQDNNIIGIGVRIRHLEPNATLYKDFTIRGDLTGRNIKSEFTKRIEAIKLGALYPAKTLCAWYKEEDNTFISGAYCNTTDLFECIGKHSYAFQSVQGIDRQFYAFPWNIMEQAGYKIVIK
jgi:hypothetical protein